MISKYDILHLQFIQLQLLCCEAIERVYARDKLGQFATTHQKAFEDKSFEFAEKQVKSYLADQFGDLSPAARLLLESTAGYKSVDKKLETISNLKQNTYSALGVTNPEIMNSAFKAGMNSPDFIKDIALPIGLLSNAKPSIDELKKLKDVKQVEDFAEAQIEKKEKEYEDNIVAKGAVTIGRSYLKHQQNMDKMRHLEDYGETEWVGEMGRVGAFGVDAAWHMTTFLGLAALPPLFGGARTLEAITPAIQAAAERKVIIPGLIKETYDLTKEGLNEKPEKIALAFAAGATTGKALNELNDFAEEHPELTEKAKAVVGELKVATEKANEFTNSVDEAMKKTGVDELFNKENLTLDEFVQGAKDLYQEIPQQQRDVIDTLSSGASSAILN
jgi:hypothetical protein